MKHKNQARVEEKRKENIFSDSKWCLRFGYGAENKICSIKETQAFLFYLVHSYFSLFGLFYFVVHFGSEQQTTLFFPLPVFSLLSNKAKSNESLECRQNSCQRSLSTFLAQLLLSVFKKHCSKASLLVSEVRQPHTSSDHIHALDWTQHCCSQQGGYSSTKCSCNQQAYQIA